MILPSISLIHGPLRAPAARLSARSGPLSLRHISSQLEKKQKSDLYCDHSSGRWLWNDEINRRKRYTPFDPDGLQEVASKVCSAQRCSKMVEMGHGFTNKVFHLQFNNGRELVARIPTPLAGNLELSTASEVATTEYVRLRYNGGSADELKAKIPRILAWDRSFKGPVRWPYILSEYIPGINLQSKWLSMPDSTMSSIMSELVDIEKTLLEEEFFQYGSLYFYDDVEMDLRDFPLYAEPPKDPLRIALSHKFRIGQVAHRDWWRRGRCEASAARGPWLRNDLAGALICAAEFQTRAIEWSDKINEDGRASINLLKRCIEIAPDLVPRDEEMLRPVLQHPDLSREKIILPAEGEPGTGPAIRGIVGWQNAVLAPLFMQSREAPAFTKDGPTKMTGHWVIPGWCREDEGEETPANLERQDIHSKIIDRSLLYNRMVESASSLRKKVWWALLDMPDITDLFRSILRCSIEGPAEVRRHLFLIQESWNPRSTTPCPLEYSEKEQEKYLEEIAAADTRKDREQAVLIAVGCSDDGWVENERFDEANRLFDVVQHFWQVGGAASEEFPFFNGSYNPNLPQAIPRW